MQRPLQEHISLLEEKIQLLKTRANDVERNAEDRFQTTVDLDFAERGLAHFRKAYELEQSMPVNISD